MANQSPYFKRFEIRWTDIDANRHVSASAINGYMLHTRMTYLVKSGFGQDEFRKLNIGPVILAEEFYYFKELHSQDQVYVNIKLKGLSKDMIYTEFSHTAYNQNGNRAAFGRILFGWMDLKVRKLVPPPEKLAYVIRTMYKESNYKELTQVDLKSKHLPEIDKIDISTIKGLVN